MRHPPTDVQFIGSFPDRLPVLDLPEIAFAGRSNVGKSSAINCLLGRKAVARVSSTPGRTQTINLFQLDDRLVFADLPGYGFAKVPEAIQRQWKGMVEGYLGEREALRLVIVLVDARREAQEIDGALLDGLMRADIPTLVVATKIDKLSRNERRKHLDAITAGHRLRPDQVIPFSAVTPEGRAEVWERIGRASGLS